MKNTLLFILPIIISLQSCDTKTKKDNIKQSPKQIIKKVYDTTGISLSNIEHLHTRRNINSYDKSLIDYINSNPNKPDSLHNIIYLQPFGNIKPDIQKIIEEEVEYLKIFFQLDVKVLPNITFDEIKKNGRIKTRLISNNEFSYYSKMKGQRSVENLREQIEVYSFINSFLDSKSVEKSIAVLGVTEHDIYAPKYNYLFGTSISKDNVGLISTFRLIDYGRYTRENIRKVISKQIVNIFSIRNVKDYECLVNFHNNKRSLEMGEFKLSPRVLEKLKYSIGFKYEKRFEELRDFWKVNENKELEKYYEECLNKTKNR